MRTEHLKVPEKTRARRVESRNVKTEKIMARKLIIEEGSATRLDSRRVVRGLSGQLRDAKIKNQENGAIVGESRAAANGISE